MLWELNGVQGVNFTILLIQRIEMDQFWFPILVPGLRKFRKYHIPLSLSLTSNSSVEWRVERAVYDTSCRSYNLFCKVLGMNQPLKYLSGLLDYSRYNTCNPMTPEIFIRKKTIQQCCFMEAAWQRNISYLPACNASQPLRAHFIFHFVGSHNQECLAAA